LQEGTASRPTRVLIAGGGTGGHIIPALAIADELRARNGAEILFVGTARGLESRLVPQAGYRLELIRAGQLNRVSVKTRIRTLMDLPLGFMQCMRILRQFRPEVAIGVGGYASGPMMGAAILRRIPTLAFEPNAVPGLANRLIGSRVKTAAVNFETAAPYFHNAHITGIPVRAEFFRLAERPSGAAPHLLVFGGSQGARALNALMPKIARSLLGKIPSLTILHQAGAGHADSTLAAYQASGAPPERWQVVAFLDDMPRRFEAADLVLARSGASTVAELAAAGKPAVLVPLPTAADDHQRKNAEVMAQAGAARMLLEPDLTPEQLEGTLRELLGAPEELRRMAGNAGALAHPDAAERIAGMAMALARGDFRRQAF
jgi:UDP-N-acetylglucosamine--N-acetylmuramyl-(pentapeptide) pyrophosphoryl-undecaprenol N-acetylglucosamine transferase